MSRTMSLRPLFKASFFAFATAILGGFPSACSSPEATELLVGVSTQVEVPRELQTVRLDVLAGPDPIFCSNYEVFNGRVQLPRTLGLTKQQANLPITVAIYGFLQKKDALPLDCKLAPKVKNADDPNLTETEKAEAARVLRRSIQPYIDDQILYIPMPLKYACFDKECPKETDTCKAGRCVDATTDPKTLLPYQEGFTNGSSSTCFPLKDCMFGAGAAPMQVLDKATCRYKVPGGSLSNMNVMLAFDEFVVELLDQDKDEGFFFPDPQGQPDVIQLTDALCKGEPVHKILSVVASASCPPKSIYQPICNNGDIPLTPATSSVYVLIDPAIGGDSWSKPSAGETKSLKEQIEGALALPSFSNTSVVVEVLPPSPPGTPSCGAPAGPARVSGRITDVYKGVQTLLNLSGGAAHASIPTALSRVFLAAAGDA